MSFFTVKKYGALFCMRAILSILTLFTSIPVIATSQSSQKPPSESLTNTENFEDHLKILGEKEYSESESIDLSSGYVSWRHTDIKIPTNGMDIVISRTYTGNRGARLGGGNSLQDISFGDWALDIPSIQSGSVAGRKSPWLIGESCVGDYSGNFSYYPGVHGVAPVSSFWNGDKLYPEGELLYQSQDKKFSRKTKSNWKFECLNIDVDGGFKGYSPDGKVYTFNKKSQFYSGMYNTPYGIDVLLVNAFLVTKIEDRFGNYLLYNYESDYLSSIESNDGVVVNFEYFVNGGGNNHRTMSKIKYLNKEISYEYIKREKIGSGEWDFTKEYKRNDYILKKVVLPNGDFYKYDMHNYDMSACNESDLLSGKIRFKDDLNSTIEFPSGKKIEYEFRGTLIGRENVEINRYASKSVTDKYGRVMFVRLKEPYCNFALTKKRLYGAGIDAIEWNYNYSEQTGSGGGVGRHYTPRAVPHYKPDGLTIVENKSTEVKLPDGSYEVYYFNRDFNSQIEGKIVNFIKLDNLKNLISISSYDYYQSVFFGESGLFWDNTKSIDTISNLKQVTETIGSDTYKKEFLEYNEFSQLITSKESNDFSNDMQYKKTEYIHDKERWVLNLPIKSYISNSDAFNNPYYELVYGNNLLPSKETLNGNKYSIYSYHDDGNLLQVSHGLTNGYKRFENYYRGKARKITLPCATTNGCNTANGSTSNTIVTLLEVNSDGTTKSVTDFNGNKTSYSYNPIGWLTKIDYSDTKWTDKVISYAIVNSLGDGISGSDVPAGSLRQTISQGNYEKRIYHDGLLRPILTQEHDLSNLSTTRYQSFAYDHDNRQILASFPSSGASNRIGMETQYDALGRVIKQTRTSDGSASRREYISGNKVAITDGENNTTTTTYLAYGEPSFDKPTLIEAPDSDDIAIEYNLFGQVTRIRQGNVTETRVYDAYQQLCKQVRPETGISAFGYNGQRQQIWRAEGTNGSTTACDAGAVPTTHKVLLSYDNLGQLITENFPDTTPDKTYSYDGNGNLTSLLAGSVSWTYLYNSLNTIEKETLAFDGKNYVLDWEYNSLGGRSSLKYPSGAIVDFAPNALGQATRAGSYASGVSYHPNGQIKQFTYGNGIIRNVALDTTGRIDVLTDIKAGSVKNSLELSYDYNDNLASLIDNVDSLNEIDNMAYDGMNRLLSADGRWSAARYTYDGLGNITLRNISNSKIKYHYNELNQLSNISGAYAYSYKYDKRGNVISNGRYDISYNLGQQMTAAKGINYVYDGHNRRVKQTNKDGSHYTVYSNGGQLLHRQAADGTKTDNVYLGKQLVAEVDNALQGIPTIDLSLDFKVINNKPTHQFVWKSTDALSCSGVIEKKLKGILKSTVSISGLAGNHNEVIDDAADYLMTLTCSGAGGKTTSSITARGLGPIPQW